MGHVRIVSSTILFSLLAILVLSQNSLAWTIEDAGWYDVALPYGGNCQPWLSLALDSEGKPQVMYDLLRGYMGDYHSYVRWAYQDSSVTPHQWHYETLRSGIGTSHIDGVLYLNIDSLDNPTAAFWSWGYTWEVLHAERQSPDNWSLSPMPVNTPYFHSTIDSSDTRHVGWYDLSGGEMKWAYYDGVAWQVDVFDSEDGHTHPGISMDTDLSNNPHIAYFKDDGLHYAFYDGEDWLLETIDDTAGTGTFNPIAVDNFGNAHVAYSDGSGDINYAWRDEAGWHTEFVTAGVSPDIEVNPFVVKPYISFIQEGNLIFGERVNEAWEMQIAAINVFEGSDVTTRSSYTDIELHFQGSAPVSVGIAYQSSIDNNNIKLASTLIPEPGTIALLSAGLLGIAGVLRRKFRNH